MPRMALQSNSVWTWISHCNPVTEYCYIFWSVLLFDWSRKKRGRWCWWYIRQYYCYCYYYYSSWLHYNMKLPSIDCLLVTFSFRVLRKFHHGSCRVSAETAGFSTSRVGGPVSAHSSRSPVQEKPAIDSDNSTSPLCELAGGECRWKDCVCPKDDETSGI
jgi:hypothetical protein